MELLPFTPTKDAALFSVTAKISQLQVGQAILINKADCASNPLRFTRSIRNCMISDKRLSGRTVKVLLAYSTEPVTRRVLIKRIA